MENSQKVSILCIEPCIFFRSSLSQVHYLSVCTHVHTPFPSFLSSQLFVFDLFSLLKYVLHPMWSLNSWPKIKLLYFVNFPPNPQIFILHFQLQTAFLKKKKKKNSWSALVGSIGWTTNAWFQLGSGSQGHGIKPPPHQPPPSLGSLPEILSLPLLLLLLALMCSLSKNKYIFKQNSWLIY